ncbi:ligninase H2 [Xylariomycetidae sp. FL0641]|nr:ligninase H2 [Xylariomycetidae sp. FL0641]
MRCSRLLASLALLSTLPFGSGFTSLNRLKELAKLAARNPVDANAPNGDLGDDSFELLGDLATLPPDALTATGRAVRELLLHAGAAPESDVEYADVPAPGSPACAADPCCVWKHLADTAMVPAFRGPTGRCTAAARRAIRLGFHDAATWSKASPARGGGGGADGSVCLSEAELGAAANAGLAPACAQLRGWRARFPGVGMADLVQVAASVATVVCPLGPRVRTFVGRRDDDAAAGGRSAELLPDASAAPADLVRLFRDKTLSPHALVALVGAHTVSRQRAVDAGRAGDPQDSTPGVWDVRFYGETDGSLGAPDRVFHIPSDTALAGYAVTADEWAMFSGVGGQEHWNFDYAMAYIRLSLLGVNNINNLTECTKALPRRTATWLDTSTQSPATAVVARTLEQGDIVNSTMAVSLDDSRDAI